MQVRLIALAALASCGAAHALTPAQIDAARTAGTLKEVYVAGASAQRLFVGAWFQEQCKPTTFDVFFNGTGTAPSGSNHRAYSCELSKKVGNWAAGTKVLFVKRDQGGSTQGVVPVASGAAQDFMAVDGTCTATGKPSPATDILNAGYACNNVFSRLADAGVSDVEPALLNKSVNLPAPAVAVSTSNLDVATINQTIMAVAVNKKAYRALQEAQGLIGAGAALDDDPAKQPSLPRTFVSAAFSGKLSGGTADRRGWNVVIPASVDADVENKQLNVCRRNIGSGTQAAFNVEFLNNDCNPSAVHELPVLGQTTGTANSTVVAPTTTAAALGTQWWNLASGSGSVESCLGSTVENAAGTAYGIGVLSRENTPTPTGTTTDKGYRFVKLDGIAPTRDNAKVGAYGFVYAASMQWNKTTLTDANVKSFLSQMRSNAGRASSLNIADVDTQEGVLAPPTSYSGPYAALTDAVTLKFASRVARNTAVACSPLAIVK